MHPKALLEACAELVGLVLKLDHPADAVVSRYFRDHRQLGPRERATLAETVYAVLRRKLQFDHFAPSGSGPRERRMAILGFAGPRDFLKSALSDTEKTWLDACDAVSEADLLERHRHNLPEWLVQPLKDQVGADFWPLAESLLRPAPLDLRVNALADKREDVRKELARAGIQAQPTPYSPWGLRLDDKPALTRLEAFTRGAIEVQDEGSQLVSQLCAPDTSMQVIDLCAGGGGKTLALAALMNNHGQIFATDTDTRRLAPIYDRLDRAGVRNVQVRSPKGKGDDPLADLEGKADLVVVDAPCTGTGTWRRNPDAKWRVRPGALEQRQNDQAAVLDRAADLVKKGGRIAYITCSLLPPENDDAVDAFLARHPGFTLEAVDDVARRAGLAALAQYRSIGGQGILLTPLRTKTDGFFFASLLRTD